MLLLILTFNLKERNPNLREMCWLGKCISTIPGHTAKNGLHTSSTTDVLTKPQLFSEDRSHISEKVMDFLINCCKPSLLHVRAEVWGLWLVRYRKELWTTSEASKMSDCL